MKMSTLQGWLIGIEKRKGGIESENNEGKRQIRDQRRFGDREKNDAEYESRER